MNRPFTMVALSVVAAIGISASAQASPCPALSIDLISLNANGSVTRSVYVKKSVKDSNGNTTETKPVRVIRDRLHLVTGDEVTLNANPSRVDGTVKVKVRLDSQDRDEKGLLSTTYHVVEIRSGGIAGDAAKPIERAYLAKIPTNYAGDGKYNSACGEMVKTTLGMESSTDVESGSGF